MAINMDTQIHFILDRSGSMWETIDDTIGGFNSFIEEQQRLENKCIFSLYYFDHEYDVVCKNIDIREVRLINRDTYQPRGQTALFDAIGMTIRKIIPNDDNIIVVILTDGQENSSREYRKDIILSMIKEKEELGWSFIYLGANQDAIESANTIGINSNSAMTYSSNAVRGCFSAVSGAITRVRTREQNQVHFTPQERSESFTPSQM